MQTFLGSTSTGLDHGQGIPSHQLQRPKGQGSFKPVSTETKLRQPLPFPIASSLMPSSKRTDPCHATFRFEAVWSIAIARQRSREPIVAQLLKQLQPEVRNVYQPDFAKKVGFLSSIVHCSMEEVDSDGSWPEW